MPDSLENTALPPIIGYGSGWMVVDKPSGISVHNDPGADLCSIINRRVQEDRSWRRRIELNTQYGIHPVHRLDRETSGIILLACRPDVFKHFSRQFELNDVIKHYLALVHGEVMDVSDVEGHWQWPLAPKAAGRSNPRGRGHRKPCSTRYTVLEQSRHYTLLNCLLHTGRTHQIRRHAALAGHPVLGDRRYGSKRACRYLDQHHQFNRLALHSAGLTVKTPDSLEPQHFGADKLPGTIRRLLDADQ